MMLRRAMLTRPSALLLRQAVRCFANYELTNIQLPALSPTMTHGNITSWVSKPGGEMSVGDILCEIETDKAVVAHEMQDDCVLAKILVPEGTANVAVGSSIAWTVADAEEYAEFVKDDAAGKVIPPSDGSAPPAIEEAPVAAVAVTTPATSADSSSEPPRRIPSIKFLGKRSLLASKPAAAVSKPALSAPAAAAVVTPPAAGARVSSVNIAPAEADGRPFEDVPVSGMRKVIASRLTESKATIPHAYASIAVPIDAALEFRKTLKAMGVKVSVNDLVIRAAALALRDVPEMNCRWGGEQGILAGDGVDVCVAVATPSGLITPIVANAQTKGLSQISSEVAGLARRAREGKLSPAEYQGGSFTISNLGGFGIDHFTAVINPPQAAILAVGKGVKTVVPAQGGGAEGEEATPEVQTRMTVTLSTDRRVADDELSAQFLQTFQAYMSNPLLMGV